MDGAIPPLLKHRTAASPNTSCHLIRAMASSGAFAALRATKSEKGGVYLELEAVALTRDIPGSLA
jgi:hypothetical protein